VAPVLAGENEKKEGTPPQLEQRQLVVARRGFADSRLL